MIINRNDQSRICHPIVFSIGGLENEETRMIVEQVLEQQAADICSQSSVFPNHQGYAFEELEGIVCLKINTPIQKIPEWIVAFAAKKLAVYEVMPLSF